MPPETALLESRTLRDSVAERIEALDKVKALAMLPDGLHVTSSLVAAYFEVGETAIRSLVKRHRDELRSHGLITLRGPELRAFERSNLDLSEESYPQGRAHLALFTRRAVLNVAMLLRDSQVARRIRTYLLDTERAYRDRQGSHQRATVSVDLEALVTDAAATAAARILDGTIGVRLRRVEERLDDVGSALRELAPVIARFGVRLERVEQRLEAMDGRLTFVDRRLDNTERIVCGISARTAAVDNGLKTLRTEIVRQRRRRPPGR